MSTLHNHVKEWLRLDRNPVTRGEIENLWSEKKFEELERRMSSHIEFGTADLIVIQASQGLSEYVAANVENALSRGIVVGYDHRYNSKHWAELTAAIFLQRGFKVFLYQGLVHTPLVPFGVKHLSAACGVMITASHNPKQDNGYKVYWENAVQIIAPHDEGIAKAIESNLEPRPMSWSTECLAGSDLCLDRTTEMKDAYFASLKSFDFLLTSAKFPDIKVVNTSMHGVSDPFVRRALELFGFPPFIPVLEQQKPDPEFPTVQFPNPEEKGALNLALATAEKHGASYVLAQDPDSDRFSAAEKQPSGRWNIFTGDQLGTLFASHLIEKYKEMNRDLSKIAMVASTVSSKMIETIAKVEGFKFKECLTGFKYIGNTGLDLVREGYDVPFGYEEAIGFMFGNDIRDKDGVAATIAFMDLVSAVRTRGMSVFEYLESLYKRYGYFKSSNGYFICTDSVKIDTIFHRLRNFKSSESGVSYPTTIANIPVTRVVDLTRGYDSQNPPSFQPSLPLSSGHMIQFRAGGTQDDVHLILTIRTSGTEPKIKYYLEGSGKDPIIVEGVLTDVVKELNDVWMEAEKYGLIKP